MNSNILIIDDSETARVVERIILEGVGNQVGLAGNRLEAIEILGNENFDLIIIDYNMPDINGIELSKELIGRDLNQGSPIVVFTSFKTEKLDRECEDAGVSACMSKNDFRKEHFVNDLEFVIGGGVEWTKKAS